ncbi:MAG: hypothetical protein PHV33_04910 [Elusimicrobiales bacterium]|nr:hypothetical protein [Elusimicrobiales bacterium]
MKKLLLLLPLAALAGCAGYLSVKVKHRLPAAPAASRPALGALYLVIKPPPPEEGELSSLAGALLGKSGPDMNFQSLARRAAKMLRQPGSRLCAWRVEKGGGKPSDFADRLNPSGLLVLTLGAPSVSYKKEERSAVQYDRKRKKQTVKSKVWAYSATLPAEVHLLAWPGEAVLDSWAEVFTVSEDRFDKAKEESDWYTDNEEKLFAQVAGRIADRYAGRVIERFRPVFAVKKDEESEKAAELAGDGRWEEASAVWRARLPQGGWRDQLGLAVAAEVGKDYAAAEEAYRRAQALAEGDKAAKPVRWGEIYRDLERARAVQEARKCDQSWFEVKTALLPFSDETTSIDGPVLARQLLFAQLKEAGYSLLPLEETDERLRRRGFSDGGQLTAAKPGDLSAWLEAGRLVFGDITDYGEIMAGVYNRRMIKGGFRVWAPGEQELSFGESVVRVKAPKSLLGGLAGQLAKGLVERVRNKPLAYEAGIFSRQAAENLPAAVK